MVDKNCIQQVLGGIIKNPKILSEIDKYSLSIADFSSRFEKLIFQSVKTLHDNGAEKIQIVDIENSFSLDAVAKKTFEQNNGIEYLQDIIDFVEEGNFDYYYKKLKKINLLRDFQKMGIDTSEFYMEDLTKKNAFEINSKFEELEIKDIVSQLKSKILQVEKEYINNDATEVRSAADGFGDLLVNIATGIGMIGMPLQGKIFNEVVTGARKGKFYLRSGGSGVSKTRQSVGDACYLAYPIRYNQTTCEWEQVGNNEKVLFIATEQNFDEIQLMILSYLTGINEDRFKYGNFNEREADIIKKANMLVAQYSENFNIVRMPNPTIELVKNIVRENCLTRGVEYVFYDYIFISPSLLDEFKGFNLRNDEVLLMFSTALKDLAVEQNIFVMSSTQLNAKGDDNTNIRNEGALAGGRSTINKADIGVIMARPTKEELEFLTSDDMVKSGFVLDVEPNLVTDIYKIRSGRFTQTRIWSYIDLGTLRKEDLFITDSQFRPIVDFESHGIDTITNWEDGQFLEINKLVKELNKT